MDITEVQKITLVPLKKHARSCTLAKCEFYTKARISFAKITFISELPGTKPQIPFKICAQKWALEKATEHPKVRVKC